MIGSMETTCLIAYKTYLFGNKRCGYSKSHATEHPRAIQQFLIYPLFRDQIP